MFHTSPYCLFSDGVDEYVVNKFISQVFTSDENLQGKICSLVKETASRKFDMKEEVVPYCYFLFSILKSDVNVKYMSLTMSIRFHALRCSVAAYVVAGDAHNSNAVGVG